MVVVSVTLTLAVSRGTEWFPLGEPSAGSFVGRNSDLFLRRSADVFQSTDLATGHRTPG